ncbi:MAG TPA: DUF1036 domain-containing protein [Rhizomicrobium sp.]|nr:DUF1036 domain-containing protein [Rhizomicrobium sp.]
MSLRRALLPLALLAVCLMAKPAQAALTLCNRTSYILYAATSAIHPPGNDTPGSDTQGWTRIVPGDCQVARQEPLTAESYLVHARSGIAHSGPARAWGGATSVCVKDGDFSLKQSAIQPYCTAEDTFALPFAAINTGGKRAWTMNFDEAPAMSLSEAQLAGVKRLLKDNGYKISRIDGKPDKTTGAALTDFRARMHFTSNAGNAELFNALEQEAAKKIAPSGYTVCNDAADVLLVALGQIEHGKPVSRGWWTVEPKACAKALTTPLKTDTVYLLAQRKNGATLVGGTRKFCVTPVIFEIEGAQNCLGRGLVEAGFAATPTKGKAGYVTHIGPNGLVGR